MAKYIDTKTSQLIMVISHDQVCDCMDGPLANCGMDTGLSYKVYQSLVIEAK